MVVWGLSESSVRRTPCLTDGTVHILVPEGYAPGRGAAVMGSRETEWSCAAGRRTSLCKTEGAAFLFSGDRAWPIRAEAAPNGLSAVGRGQRDCRC